MKTLLTLLCLLPTLCFWLGHKLRLPPFLTMRALALILALLSGLAWWPGTAHAQAFGSFITDKPFFGQDNASSAPWTDNDEYVLVKYDFNTLSYSIGDPIDTAVDLGPYGFNASSAGNARPYWTNNPSAINGNAWADFDGVNDLLTNAFGGPYTNPIRVVAVVMGYSAPASTYQRIVDNFGTATQQQMMLYIDTGGIWGNIWGTSEVRGELGTAAWGNWMIMEGVWNGASSEVRTNQVLIASGDTGTSSRTGVALGTRRTLGAYGKLRLAYIGIYTNLIDSVAESNKVWNIGQRFGITTYTRN